MTAPGSCTRSNFGLPRHAEFPGPYTDAYLIDLAPAVLTTAGSSDPVAIRLEQNAAAVTYSGSWHSNASSFHSGGDARLAMESGARASFTFAGTGVRWIGHRDEWSGMANVYIDGALEAVVDAFGPSQHQQVLFTRMGLANGPHTLEVEPATQRNPLSGGNWVWVDAFEVVTRLEQDDAAIHYSCPPDSAWFAMASTQHSRGSAVVSMAPGCQVTLAFTGPAVSWIGYRDDERHRPCFRRRRVACGD